MEISRTKFSITCLYITRTKRLIYKLVPSKEQIHTSNRFWNTLNVRFKCTFFRSTVKLATDINDIRAIALKYKAKVIAIWKSLSALKRVFSNYSFRSSRRLSRYTNVSFIIIKKEEKKTQTDRQKKYICGIAGISVTMIPARNRPNNTVWKLLS